jgi:phosphoserine phosphatase
VVDRWSRPRCQSLIFKRYRKYSALDLEAEADELFQSVLTKKFIPYVHDLVFYLKQRNVHVHLLSTNIEPVVKQYASYFQVPYSCLSLKDAVESEPIDFGMLNDFKWDMIKEYEPASTIVIADSTSDLPILNHVRYPVIVTKRIKSWMRLSGVRLIIVD